MTSNSFPEEAPKMTDMTDELAADIEEEQRDYVGEFISAIADAQAALTALVDAANLVDAEETAAVPHHLLTLLREAHVADGKRDPIVMPQWVYEQGAEYRVPAEVVALGDQSWHNDACPSFGTDYVRLWVEHPDATMRDSGMSRYCVTDDRAEEDGTGQVVYDGDDMAAAVEAWRAVTG